MRSGKPPDLNTLRSGYMSDALQPAVQAFHCHCRKPGCVFRPGYLVPFRTHIANLHHVITDAQYGGSFSDRAANWSAVTYQLKMAASVEDLLADTGFVDLSGSIAFCRPAAEYEDRHSKIASRYAAALIVFNFIWAAYEAAVKAGALGFLPKESTAFRGRALMVEQHELGIALKCLRRLTRHTVWAVLHPADLERERTRVDSFATGSAAQAAELARIFRNHIAHGSDEPPYPGQDHEGCRTLRFFAVSRLLLLLIQIVAIQALANPSALYQAWDESNERRSRTLRTMLLRLQLNACHI